MTSYEIFQVKHECIGKCGFLPYDPEIAKMENYESVYKGKIKMKGTPEQLLELLFRKFNIDHPDGYAVRSMSVSDIVALDGNMYYCNPVGWVAVQLS